MSEPETTTPDDALPLTQADIDAMSETAVRRRLGVVAQQIPVDRVSHPEWIAKEEYRRLSQRLVDLQTDSVAQWTKDVRDMTRTLTRLTWAMFVITLIALLVAVLSLLISLRVIG